MKVTKSDFKVIVELNSKAEVICLEAALKNVLTNVSYYDIDWNDLNKLISGDVVAVHGIKPKDFVDCLSKLYSKLGNILWHTE